AAAINCAVNMLFKFFQKEISELLIQTVVATEHPDPVQLFVRCMKMFRISYLSRELLRYVIPPMVLLRNEQTKALFDGISSFTQNKHLSYPFQVCCCALQ